MQPGAGRVFVDPEAGELARARGGCYLVRTGGVANYAQLARLGNVSRPRMTQILNLVNLAPDIQEAILFSPRIQGGRAPIILRDLQEIAAIPEWKLQRTSWAKLLETV